MRSKPVPALRVASDEEHDADRDTPELSKKTCSRGLNTEVEEDRLGYCEEVNLGKEHTGKARRLTKWTHAKLLQFVDLSFPFLSDAGA